MHTPASKAPLREYVPSAEAVDECLRPPKPWKEEFPPFVVQGAAEAVCESIPNNSAEIVWNESGNCLESEAARRKSIPLCTGVLDYFPDALMAVAQCSKVGNDQHNFGQPLHWAREKSADHADCLLRHLVDRGKIDSDGVRHAAKAAWRCLALLQLEIEASNDRQIRSAD